ncbi:MAG: cytochrome C oxidase subunit IV family protein [Planctomycetes bacterium]|nr:cytochrome C oxidase subunit IV family protein [Planctomycetota bacterium]
MAHAGSTKDGQQVQSKKATFFTIFFILAVLTVIEVFVPQVYSAEWNSHTKMLLLCGLAISKATLVGLYFMHLKWEKPWLKYIALMPVYMGVFAIILMLETVYRQVGR